MTTVTVHCDHCGAVIEKDKQLWIVQLAIKERSTNYQYGDGFTLAKKVEWCRPCLEFGGLVPSDPKNPPPEEKKVTIEDMIREIVRQESAN